MNTVRFIVIIIGFFFQLNISAQQIKIATSNQSLNQVLNEIKDKYDVHFSFDPVALSKYKVNLNKSFPNVEKTLEHLLKDLPYAYEKSAGVYVIFPSKKEKILVKKKIKPKVYSISGRILEEKTNEVLPYSNILINSTGLISDANGNFKYSSTKDSVFRVKISHLGYFAEDTMFYRAYKNIKVFLTPAEFEMVEIEVNENVFDDFSTSSNEAATIKLNHKVTKYLPGSSDNSVFNLLRLQPGVLASGEQSSDLVLWGSYAGQSRVLFDGFTVFGLKNFNDNISAINPLITKNIQLKKAGYDASYGDCVGGIVDISGKDGNYRKPGLYLGINNLTINGLLELPILQKSALQVAYRQTYYNLYKDGYNLIPKESNGNNSIGDDLFIYPDYLFRDVNVKYSYKDDLNTFYISTLFSNDEFSYFINREKDYRNITKTTTETNEQKGVSLFYERKFNEKLSSNITASTSSLNSKLNDNYLVTSTISDRFQRERDFNTYNHLQETKLKYSMNYQTRNNNSLNIVLQAVNNDVNLKEDSAGISRIDESKNETYYSLGLKDVITYKNIQFNVGARTIILPYLNKTFFDPRISFSHNLTNKIRYNLAWGVYHQYLVKSSVVDELGNYRYNWVIAEEEVPVLKSNHYVGGISFGHKQLFISLDAFYKTTQGLTRYFKMQHGNGFGNNRQITEGVFEGDGKNYGFDFYTKYNLGGHTAWLSYTWSKSLEHFDYFKATDYLYAPQDQRHEVKLAAIINFNPVYFSANYVYGSGFLEKPYQQLLDDSRKVYNRVDLSATYKFSADKMKGEVGISILNVFNTLNQKFSNFEKVPISQSSSAVVYYEAVPFTPTLFLSLKF